MKPAARPDPLVHYPRPDSRAAALALARVIAFEMTTRHAAEAAIRKARRRP